MKEIINFILVPDNLLKYIGKPDPNTRFYRQYGDDKKNSIWWDAIMSIKKDISFVSPGGAASFVGVSRAAVYKRLKEGRLTAFAFYTVKDKNFLTINYQKLADSGFPSELYIPWCELKNWRTYIKKRKIAFKGNLTIKEFTGDEKFIKAPKDWKKGEKS